MIKQNVVYTYTRHYSASRKEILQYGTTEMNLEDMMLKEISQSQKGKYCMIPLIRGI